MLKRRGGIRCNVSGKIYASTFVRTACFGLCGLQYVRSSVIDGSTSSNPRNCCNHRIGMAPRPSRMPASPPATAAVVSGTVLIPALHRRRTLEHNSRWRRVTTSAVLARPDPRDIRCGTLLGCSRICSHGRASRSGRTVDTTGRYATDP